MRITKMHGNLQYLFDNVMIPGLQCQKSDAGLPARGHLPVCGFKVLCGSNRENVRIWEACRKC